VPATPPASQAGGGEWSSRAPSRRSAFPPVDGFRGGGHLVKDAGDELGVAAPTAGEAKLPQLLGGAVVMVDCLIDSEGIDLAGSVTIDRRGNVGQQFGQLCLVVGAHPFAGGVPFGLVPMIWDATLPQPICELRSGLREPEPLADSIDVQLAGGHGHGQVERCVVRQVKTVTVDSQEHHGGKQGEPFVAVDQCVVAS